jgi:tRNA(Ile)-lysidine synthase
LPDAAQVLLACSGGADSTALAVLTARARPDLRVTLAYVAHGLRGPDVDAAEQARVAALAAQLGAEHVALPVNVVPSGAGVESDARDARHTALEAEVVRRGATAVLLGHHADDQAETLLLRLARGTGVEGLAGMLPVAGPRMRPLLDVRRHDLHRAAQDVHPGVLDRATHDPMNDDVAFARVRVREQVLPALDLIGPDVVGALTRLAVIARDESVALDAAVTELVASLPLVSVGCAIAIPSAGLRALPDGLARRVLRAAFAVLDTEPAAAVHRRPDATVVERLLRAPDGWRATLPGPLDAEVGRGWHVIVPSSAPSRVAGPGPKQPLSGAASVQHEPSGMRLTLTPVEPATPGMTDSVTLIALPSGGLPPGLVSGRLRVELRGAGPLQVRTRRDGDRVRTPGGTRSLSDVMAEAGVPRALRGLLPVVVGEDDRVGWVPGLVVDEAVRAGTHTGTHTGTHADARPDASPAPRPAPR